MGKIDDAIADAAAAVKVDPEDNSAMMLLAHFKYMKACTKRKVSSEEGKDDKIALVAQRSAEQLLTEATNIFHKVLERDGGAYSAQLGIGAIFAHRGKRNEAKLLFKSLQDNLYAPAEVNLAVNCGHLMMDYGRSDDTAYDKAIAYYRRAFELNNENADIIMYLAIAYYKRGRLTDAE